MLEEHLKTQACDPAGVRLPAERAFVSPARDLTMYVPRVVSTVYSQWMKAPPYGVRSENVPALGESLKYIFSDEGLETCRTEDDMIENSKIFLTDQATRRHFFYEVGIRCTIAAWYGNKVNMPAQGTRADRLASVTNVDPYSYVEYFEAAIARHKKSTWLTRGLRRLLQWLEK